jgi:hypothetical protein
MVLLMVRGAILERDLLSIYRPAGLNWRERTGI